MPQARSPHTLQIDDFDNDLLSFLSDEEFNVDKGCLNGICESFHNVLIFNNLNSTMIFTTIFFLFTYMLKKWFFLLTPN